MINAPETQQEPTQSPSVPSASVSVTMSVPSVCSALITRARAYSQRVGCRCLTSVSHCVNTSQCHQMVDHVCVNSSQGLGICQHKGILPVSWHGTKIDPRLFHMRPGARLARPSRRTLTPLTFRWRGLLHPLSLLCCGRRLWHGRRTHLRPHPYPHLRLRGRVCHTTLKGAYLHAHTILRSCHSLITSTIDRS